MEQTTISRLAGGERPPVPIRGSRRDVSRLETSRRGDDLPPERRRREHIGLARRGPCRPGPRRARWPKAQAPGRPRSTTHVDTSSDPSRDRGSIPRASSTERSSKLSRLDCRPLGPPGGLRRFQARFAGVLATSPSPAGGPLVGLARPVSARFSPFSSLFGRDISVSSDTARASPMKRKASSRQTLPKNAHRTRAKFDAGRRE